LDLIAKINKVFEAYGIVQSTSMNLQGMNEGDIVVSKIEEELRNRLKAQETYIQRNKDVEEHTNLINQELSKQEIKYQERVKEIEKNNAAWKNKLEELENALKNKEIELKDAIEKLESSEADRKQKSIEIESLRKINDSFTSER